jgi:hypothetical protein
MIAAVKRLAAAQIKDSDDELEDPVILPPKCM